MADCEFVSFHQVLRELGEPYSERVQLASFMSASKGVSGECGLRGGYVHMMNFNQGVMREFTKSLTAKLCPSILGQVSKSGCAHLSKNLKFFFEICLLSINSHFPLASENCELNP